MLTTYARRRLVRTARAGGIASLIAVALLRPVGAAPYIPASDGEVLEQLPLAAQDPALRQVRALGEQLRREPSNLSLAIAVARRYFDLGGLTGDPRYGGYAEAALRPWWALDAPPAPVRLLRAALRQRLHQFDAAVSDLDALLRDDAGNLRALLTRATVHQVRGEFDASRADCMRLTRLTAPLVSATCLANAEAMTGALDAAQQRLQAALEAPGAAAPEIREWALTGLGEMAARAGRRDAAERLFLGALAIDGTDNYLLAAYSDFLLDGGRASEAAARLREKTRIDPLLLRYALALRELSSPDLSDAVAQLRDRFDAARLRGDQVHLREEAIFRLKLMHDPAQALRLALENWQVQKEPADIRILAEAARAANDAEALDVARNWIAQTKYEDVRLDAILLTAAKPIGSSSRTP